MTNWIELGLAFTIGFLGGAALVAFLFESRVRFYKLFIEHRLATINRLRFHPPAARRSARPPFWKAVFSRRSKPDEDSKSPQR